MHALGSEEIEFAVPVERCFDWETIALAELAGGRRRGRPKATPSVPRSSPPASTCSCRAALAARARAAILLHKGEAAAAVGPASDRGRGGGSGRRSTAGRLLAQLLGRALAAAGERSEAIEELREAERELDACGSVRERDAARRELRKLGVRREARGPAAGETGVDSLTKREREIAALVTDRMTNKEIAAELFLSEKTIESHLRNIFFKLGASSRVDVARAFEQRAASSDRRRGADSPSSATSRS